ncbi:MAG: hypothetical protein EWM72_03301 [Nitrospira sp.]|nr:MAG: hypothetical protein EWM72_03301 [Nitrospira sp.]
MKSYKTASAALYSLALLFGGLSLTSTATVASAQVCQDFFSGNGPFGTLDPNNQFTANGGVTFQNARIISPLFNYHVISGTNYITADTPQSQTRRYRTMFTLPAGPLIPQLTV